MKNWLRIAPSIALLLVICPSLGAQDWAGAERARGAVVDESDAPIEGAVVNLRYELSPEGGPKALITDKKGRWKVIGLKPGPWLIEVEAEGYIGRSSGFTVFDTGVNESVKMVLPEVPQAVKDAQMTNQANELVEKGNALVTEGRYAEARAAYEEVLGILPEEKHAPILAGIASSYFKENQNEQANEALARALAIDPNDEWSLRLKIAALAGEGKEEEAREYMARLPEEAELDPNAELNLGVLRYNDGDLEAAGAIFERVRDKHPEIADAHYYCGLVYLGKEDNAAALEAFREVLKLEPEHSRAAEVSEFISFLEPAASE